VNPIIPQEIFELRPGLFAPSGVYEHERPDPRLQEQGPWLIRTRFEQLEGVLGRVREQRLPSVTFEGSYSEQGRIFADSIPAYTYTGTLHLPLWTSGRISAEIAEARLQEQRLAEQKRDIANSVLQQVRTAIDQLRASSGAVTVANNALDLARQEVARAERRFAAGVSTNIDVVTAQDQLARASNNQIEALYRYNQSRVDLARAHAWIPAQSTKGGRAIGIALSEDAVQVLRGIDREPGQERVFLYEGRPVSNAYGKAAWRKACKRAGLAGLRFHDLRHTWASWLMQAGVPAYAIQSLGGWASPKMVERYAHLSPDHLKQYAALSKLRA